jgi:hypothetical protein
LTSAQKSSRGSFTGIQVLVKRQRTGALQDASRFSGIILSRVASWTAVALHRFSTPKWTKTVLDNDEMEFKVKITKPNP